MSETKKEEESERLFDDSVVFEAEPTKINVNEEAEKLGSELKFNPEKLAKALLMMGEKMIGVELYEYQKDPAYRIIYSLLVGDGAEVTLLFSRQSGKSEVVTFVIVVIGIMLPVLSKFFKELEHFKGGVKMGLFAPQIDQVETVYFRCVERIHSESCASFLSDPDINDKLLSRVHFKLKSGSFVKAQSGAKQSRIESKTYHIVFIDESQDMDTEKVRKSIIPMTASTFGTIVRLGTPNRQKGDFFYTIRNNRIHDRKLSVKNAKQKRLHFEYDYHHIIKAKEKQFAKDGKKFHTLYKLSVERDMASMGKNSDAFRMSYALEWLFDIGMFITEQALDKVYDRKLDFPTVGKNDFIVAGLDIASARADTIVTLGKCDKKAESSYKDIPKKTVVDWLELNGSYEKQYPIIEDYLIKNNVKVLYLDYTGVGRAVGDRLIHNLSEHMDIIPYTFSIPSKSDMWKSLEEEIKAGRLVIPASPSVKSTDQFKHFEEQMLNLQKYWKGSYMLCEKTQGFKDDYCDSFALMNLAGNHLYTNNVISVEQNFLLSSSRNSQRGYSSSSW